MLLKSVSVKNFRIHDAKTVNLDEKVTVITGRNGIGKTSIIEAIYIALQGTSFKGSDKDIIHKNADWYSIELITTDEDERKVTYNKDLSKKQFLIKGQKTARIPYKYKYPICLFEPDDMRLLQGSPARRRKFIDDFISHTDRTYKTVLNKYDKALKQRNSLLKKGVRDQSLYFPWDISLSEYGAVIIEKRNEAVHYINQRINEAYANISSKKDTITVTYPQKKISSTKLYEELQNTFLKDTYISHTTVGPHRHDVLFLFNDAKAADTVSRGEARSTILALKIIEITMIEELLGVKPIVILDDVFSELDDIRQGKLTEAVQGNQTVITTVNIHTDNQFKTILLSE